MSAIGCRFVIAVAVVISGPVMANAADITPPSEKQTPRGVAEFADEFAEAEHAEKPLIAWLHPFTERIAYGPYGNFGLQSMHSAIPTHIKKPTVYLEEEVDLTAVQPTPVEQLLAQGLLGDHKVTRSPSLERVSPPNYQAPPARVPNWVIAGPDGGTAPSEQRPDITNHLAN